MKKLMIAAAVAAMTGGVFAGLCDDDPDTDECALFDVTISVKTLLPTKYSCKKYDQDPVYYLKDGNRTFNGILWMCETVCDDFFAGPNFVLWEKKTKSAITERLSWDAEAKVWTADTLVWSILDRYGAKAEKVEALWYANYGNDFAIGLTLAGFGSFDKKLMIPSQISGNCAGWVEALPAILAGCDDITQAAKVLPLCEEDFTDWCCDGDDATVVAASGTWKIKYNKSLSKGKKTLKAIVPAYAR